MNYKKVDTRIIEKLENITDKKNVITDKFTLENYAHDEMPGKMYFPEIVVKVENSAQVCEILKLANSEHIPVTPRGRGTGLSGGALPVYAGIVLSLEKMENVIDIDKKNLMVVTDT